MSFFTSGTVDTQSFSRDKLLPGVYLVEATDFADYYGATRGDRTQFNFAVVDGSVDEGTKGSHVVMHKHQEAWQTAKARGECAAMLGSLMGFNRDASGLKITGEVYEANTRVVTQNPDTGKTVRISREASELPIVGKRCFLVVSPYFEKKLDARGQKVRKINRKTGQKSVVYEFFPLSAKLTPTREAAAEDLEESGTFATGGDAEDDAPPPPAEKVDGLAAALADGWKKNGDSPWFYKKGENAQLKEPALRAKYGE